MATNFMVVCIVLAIVVLACYLFGGSDCFKKLKNGVKKRICGFIPEPIELVNGPVLEIKPHGEKKYSAPIPVDKMEFTLGSSGCDLCLNDRTVEKKHAVIRKVCNEGEVYYLLKNYGKVNPIRYYDKIKCDYCTLGYKESVQIQPGDREVFKMGKNKIIIICPLLDNDGIGSGTIRIINGDGNNEKQPIKTTDSPSKIDCYSDMVEKKDIKVI